MDTSDPQRALAARASGGQPWLASRLLHRQVVNASTLEPVGRVSDVVFNPKTCQVTALIVHATTAGDGLLAAARRAVGQRRAGGAIGIDHIVALNGDVVIVDSKPVASAVLLAPQQPSEREACLLCEACELTIITIHGMCLGELADLLLDERGSLVIGYVVAPTKYAESLLLPLEAVLPAEPPHTEQEVSAAVALPSSGSSMDAHVRVIPASPRVRIGESLIVVVEEVEPLRQDAVIISSQPIREHPGRVGGRHWRWAARRTRH